MVWLDGLDMHIVNLLAASFREDLGGKAHRIERPEGAAPAEFGNNLLPVDAVHRSQTSPIFNYPYRKSRESLDTLARTRAPDAWHVHKMKYINPVNGGWAMPTMSTWLQLLPKGFRTAPYRSTDSTVFTVVEGRGRSTVNGETFEWGPHDIFVAPSWMAHTHEAAQDAVLFLYSDRVIQEKLDIWRESKEKA
jgi:gentisate 1,2-dioxygenase